MQYSQCIKVGMKEWLNSCHSYSENSIWQVKAWCWCATNLVSSLVCDEFPSFAYLLARNSANGECFSVLHSVITEFCILCSTLLLNRFLFWSAERQKLDGWCWWENDRHFHPFVFVSSAFLQLITFAIRAECIALLLVLSPFLRQMDKISYATTWVWWVREGNRKWIFHPKRMWHVAWKVCLIRFPKWPIPCRFPSGVNFRGSESFVRESQEWSDSRKSNN